MRDPNLCIKHVVLCLAQSYTSVGVPMFAIWANVGSNAWQRV